jgi:proteasome lid subunit RPN8/RPN11
VLLGPRDGVVSRAISLDNTTDLERRRRFLIGPDEYRRAERHASDTGLEIVGFYHSHPDHPARPSQYDLDHAWPFFSYVIVSVREGVSGDMTSWRLREDRSAFDQEDLNNA